MNRLMIFNKDLWKEIIESINSNGFRTLITAFGVFWGIFILVLLLASSKGLENGVKKGFTGMATNTVFLWGKQTSKPYKGVKKGRTLRLKIQDAEAIRQNVNGLKIISPRNKLGGRFGLGVVTRNLNDGNFSVYGDLPNIFYQKSLSLTNGRFLNQGDLNEKRKVAVIGEEVKRELFRIDENPIGEYINIQGVSFMVIGVYHDNSSRDRQAEIYIPFSTFSLSFNSGNRVRFFAITANDNKSITKVKHQIIDVLKKQHKVHPEDDRAIGNFDLFEVFNKISSLFIALKIVAYFVGVLILLSGIIGISNIMLIVIKERTKEIGIRRALGATPGNIRGQILIESLFLTLISGMTGVSFGALVVFIMNELLDKYAKKGTMFINPSVDLWTIYLSLLILIICGLLAGFIPAQTAIKIKPIEALRTE